MKLGFRVVFSVYLLLWLGVGPTPAGTVNADADLPTWEVPYRMLPTGHVMVRVKLNGHGPYNLIVDTGAPSLVIDKGVCAEAGVKADAQGHNFIEQFDLEGGLHIRSVPVVVEDMYQDVGMNALGIAGARLVGSIGYSVLGHYRLDFDFTGDTMTWARLPYTPTPVKRFNLPSDSEPTYLATLAKMLAFFVGRPFEPAILRGSLGMQLEDSDAGVTVVRVLPGCAADRAGIVAGDIIVQVRDRKFRRIDQLMQLTAGIAEGHTINLTLTRAGHSQQLTLVAGKGL